MLAFSRKVSKKIDNIQTHKWKNISSDLNCTRWLNKSFTLRRKKYSWFFMSGKINMYFLFESTKIWNLLHIWQIRMFENTLHFLVVSETLIKAIVQVLESIFQSPNNTISIWFTSIFKVWKRPLCSIRAKYLLSIIHFSYIVWRWVTIPF